MNHCHLITQRSLPLSGQHAFVHAVVNGAGNGPSFNKPQTACTMNPTQPASFNERPIASLDDAYQMPPGRRAA